VCWRKRESVCVRERVCVCEREREEKAGNTILLRMLGRTKTKSCDISNFCFIVSKIPPSK